jgi:heptosyltransferase-2
MNTLSILIIKIGALGDVVRTGSLVRIFKKKHPDIKIYWHAENADYILKNLFSDLNITFVDVRKNFSAHVDLVLSMEECDDLALFSSQFLSKKDTVFYGFYKDKENIKYTLNTAAWNDMGLNSRFGIEIANNLKKVNKATYLDIWTSILNLNLLKNNPRKRKDVSKEKSYILICPWGGERWPSKSINNDQLEILVDELLRVQKKIIICGVPLNNTIINYQFMDYYKDTRNDFRKFLHYIKNCDLMITADSLAVHIAYVFKVRTISFYSPTSADEIDVTEGSLKVISSANDYCSYKPIADNSSIIAKRILACMEF